MVQNLTIASLLADFASAAGAGSESAGFLNSVQGHVCGGVPALSDTCGEVVKHSQVKEPLQLGQPLASLSTTPRAQVGHHPDASW